MKIPTKIKISTPQDGILQTLGDADVLGDILAPGPMKEIVDFLKSHHLDVKRVQITIETQAKL